jgi:cephalosporin hydroxylase
VTDRIEAPPGDRAAIAAMACDAEVKDASQRFLEQTIRHRYSYNFTWLGRPIIQYPQDIIALQEIIWKTKPDLIIETGIALGGSLIFFASMLELIGAGRVIGVDIDIREHNRAQIEQHPLSKRIEMLQGSSVDPAVVSGIREKSVGSNRIMVVLDSNHSSEHVSAELHAYAPLVSSGCYLAVMDTVVDLLPADLSFDRPWRPGDSPMTAVDAFLEKHSEFSIDEEIDKRLLVSVAPRGYLIRA